MYTLSELDEKLRQMCLLVEEKQPQKCTYEDAKILAGYAGETPHLDGHDTFMKQAMGLL